MRGRWAFALWLTASFGCTDDDTFQCVSNDQCSPDGTCEPNQYCSFPDASCDSGRRFGDQAATGIAGQCVPLESASTGAVASTGGSTTTSSSTSSELSSSGSSGSSGDSTMASESSTGGADTSGTTAATTSSGDGTSSSSGEVDPCSSELEVCEVCLDCTTPSGAACHEASQACSADAECLPVYECLRTCVLDGLCPECCQGVSPETAELAAAMMDCQTAACIVEPVCMAFAKYTCSPGS